MNSTDKWNLNSENMSAGLSRRKEKQCLISTWGLQNIPRKSDYQFEVRWFLSISSYYLWNNTACFAIFIIHFSINWIFLEISISLPESLRKSIHLIYTTFHHILPLSPGNLTHWWCNENFFQDFQVKTFLGWISQFEETLNGSSVFRVKCHNKTPDDITSENIPQKHLYTNKTIMT